MHDITLSVDTGPHRGVIEATNTFNVRIKPIYLKASAAENWVHAFGWSNDAYLILEVDDPTNGVGVDCWADTIVEPIPWTAIYPDTVGIFDLNGSCDLHPGDQLTVTGAGRASDVFSPG